MGARVVHKQQLIDRQICRERYNKEEDTNACIQRHCHFFFVYIVLGGIERAVPSSFFVQEKKISTK